MYTMSKVVSNKRQLKRLVELLQVNLDVAKAVCTKYTAQRKFVEFAKELNKLGPPQREWHKWMRVWGDLKCKIKKKKTNSMAPINLPDGTVVNNWCHFTELEEAVIEMLDLNTYDIQAEDQKEELEESISIISTEDEDEVKLECMDFEEEIMKSLEEEVGKPTFIKTEPEEEYDTPPIIETVPRPIRLPTDSYTKILEEQILAQKEFYKRMIDLMGDMKRSMSNIEDYIKRSNQQKDDLLELKRLKLKAYKEKKLEQTIERKAKLRLKAELLALKKRKVNTMAASASSSFNSK
ncbi:uncharacterized protein LOC129910112 [Episyrphus balteatus]|uniref:uncharacterized protein LOC129910112 n=1 Tax=Episyrphus balteatus TaxID=286459 RepID=UPI0024856733|nr:uncharacterized protein LOC129910112 [Episyrphus balteatus]XP_055843352.1 uncharacterized protein LOC129910112 [Episyrphus balteatus]